MKFIQKFIKSFKLKKKQSIQSLDVHLKSYARFMTKDLAENFDKELVEV